MPVSVLDEKEPAGAKPLKIDPPAEAPGSAALDAGRDALTSRLAGTLFWTFAILAAAFMIWPLWRAFLPLEIWGNEGWNAYHADSAIRGAALYPPSGGLVANNYPPLSYYVVGGLGRPFGDALYVGRALSLLATLAIGLAVSAVVRQLGGSRGAAALSGLWLVATLAHFFDFYVGMNEPQLMAHAVMMGALVWLLNSRAAGRAAEPAILLMVLAGFIKHNIVAVPIVGIGWLVWEDWRSGLRAAIVGAAAAAVGLCLCAWLFAPDFISDMLMPRTYNFGESRRLIRLQFVLPALIIWVTWAWFDRGTRPARFSALMIAAGLVTYVIEKAGAGVDENAQFDLVIATAIGVGLAYDGLQRHSCQIRCSPTALRLLVLGLLLVRLLISTRNEFAYVLLSPDFRKEAAEHAAIAHSEAARVAAMPGLVGCSNLVVCRAAGKPFAYDSFKAQMMVETGQLTWAELQARIRQKGIALDHTDPRANVTSLWRR